MKKKFAATFGLMFALTACHKPSPDEQAIDALRRHTKNRVVACADVTLVFGLRRYRCVNYNHDDRIANPYSAVE